MMFPFPLELFPFPLVAQNYSHSHGNPMGIPWEWEFPFPCTPLVQTARTEPSWRVQFGPVLFCRAVMWTGLDVTSVQRDGKRRVGSWSFTQNGTTWCDINVAYRLLSPLCEKASLLSCHERREQRQNITHYHYLSSCFLTIFCHLGTITLLHTDCLLLQAT